MEERINTNEVECSECGWQDEISSVLGIYPTDGIVWDVCRRDACPECDGQVLPRHPRLQAHPELTNAQKPYKAERVRVPATAREEAPDEA